MIKHSKAINNNHSQWHHYLIDFIYVVTHLLKMATVITMDMLLFSKTIGQIGWNLFFSYAKGK